MITVVILAKNEAENLTTLLPTLSWADQLLVIDDESTDQTAVVCERFGAKHVVRKLQDDFAGQRNFALSQIKQGWVLFLDADERMSDALVSSVKRVVSSHKNTAYQVKRTDVFLGKTMRFGETKNIWLTRLAPVDSGMWRGTVHEVWDVDSPNRLEGELLHYSHDSIKQLFEVIPRYAQLRSRELFEQKHYWSLWEQVVYPLFKFLYTFIVQLGFLDGWRGLVMSVAMSWHSWLVRWYLWETPWRRRSLGMTVLRFTAIMPWILLPFGQLTRGTVFGATIYGFEVFMLLTFLITALLGWRRKWWLSQPLWIGSALLVTGTWLVAFLVSLTQGYSAVGGLYWLRWCLYAGYGLVLWRLVQKDGYFSVAGLIRYVGYGLLGFGLVQYLLFPDMRFLSLLGWDDHYYRMIGSLFDPNFLGLLLVLGAWWVWWKTKGWERNVMMLLMLVSVMATFSRTSMVVGACLALLYGLRSKRVGLFALFVALVIGIYIVLPKPGGEGVNLLRSFSIVSRVESWSLGWRLFREHPLVGIGFNQYPAVVSGVGANGAPFHPSAPDNSWLFVLATTGLLGFIPFVGLLYRWFRSENDLYSRGVLVAILIHSLMNNSFFYPWVLLWWWLVLLENKQEKLADVKI